MRALVTGARSGLGRALAERWAGEGYEIWGTGPNFPTDCFWEKHEFIQHDLAEGVASLLEEIALNDLKFDAIVLNAGVSLVGPFETQNFKDQKRVLDVNFMNQVELVRGLLMADRIRSRGHLVFVSSLSDYLSYPGASVYAASKMAMSSYARSLAVALRPRGIAVHWVQPGPLDTAHAERYSPFEGRGSKRLSPEKAADEIYRSVKKGRREILPGFGAKFLRALSRAFPRFIEELMRRVLYLPLSKMDRKSKLKDNQTSPHVGSPPNRG